MSKKVKLLVLGIALIIVAGLGIFLYQRHVNNSKTTTAEDTKYAQTVNDTQTLVSAGKYNQAETIWLNYLKGSHKTSYVRGAYVQLATTYSNAEKYDQAISYYKKAQAIDGTDKLDVVTGLAYTYEAQGNKTDAITYFKKAITLTQKGSDPSKNADIQGFKYEISQLEGQS
jgi:tetratricopeptide (TPR) repeat protein